MTNNQSRIVSLRGSNIIMLHVEVLEMLSVVNAVDQIDWEKAPEKGSNKVETE